jgi:hypothetical protein
MHACSFHDVWRIRSLVLCVMGTDQPSHLRAQHGAATVSSFSPKERPLVPLRAPDTQRALCRVPPLPGPVRLRDTRASLYFALPAAADGFVALTELCH